MFTPGLMEMNTQGLCFTLGGAYHETSEFNFWGAFSRCLLRCRECCQGVLLPQNVLQHGNIALITPRPSARGSSASASSSHNPTLPHRPNSSVHVPSCQSSQKSTYVPCQLTVCLSDWVGDTLRPPSSPFLVLGHVKMYFPVSQ